MQFSKFNGAGNDFVALDNRRGNLSLSEHEVAQLCHRRFGVGADGVIVLKAAPEGYDFEMEYYNADGRLGTMCGNGGRCIAVYAMLLGLGRELHFLASDGVHDAAVQEWWGEGNRGVVRLGMRQVARTGISPMQGGWFLDTGSPHYVKPVVGLGSYDVEREGRQLRNRTDLFPEGTNVDFVERQPDGTLAVRTYERGVEAETWACGTGVTACALVTGIREIEARGGKFTVDYTETEAGFEDICLVGPVSLDFTGEWPAKTVC